MGKESSTEELNQLLSANDIQKIQEVVNDICYGTVTLVFQDGKLTQIDRSEKIRLKNKVALSDL